MSRIFSGGNSIHYGSGGLTEQLPADSSGIHATSSPSGSSDSSSGSSSITMAAYNVLHQKPSHPPPPRFIRPVPVTPGKNLNLMSRVTGPKSPTSPKKGHQTLSGLSTPPIPDNRPLTRASDVFLSQFQAQMSQMKSAMDAVQNEILNSSSDGTRGRVRPAAVKPIKCSSSSSSPISHLHQPPSTVTPTYHSQLSHGNGLVIKIKKSATGGKKRGRKAGGGKKKRRRVDEDIIYYGEDSEDEKDLIEVPKPRKMSAAAKRKELAEVDRNGSDSCLDEEIDERNWWGKVLPAGILHKILTHLVEMEGSIPSLVRASKVCRLWREVTLNPSLWTSVDLSTGKVRDVYRSERNLIYFLENKFSMAKHLNLGGWTSAMTHAAVEVLVRTCLDLESLNLSTCNKLSAQNVIAIAQACPNLSKLDLSAVSSMYNTRNAVSPSGIGDATEIFGSRLLQLSLASNCMGNLPQILSSLADNCTNIQVLDLSNINSPRRDSIIIRIEQLQLGCPSLKVLRLTNADIILSETSIKDQVSSPGFTKLEELSIAVDPKRSQGMDDNDLERIVKNSVKLRLLDARGCMRISDSGLVRLPAWELEHLYLSGCFATKSSTDGLELIFRKWRHSFKEIDISWTPSEETISLAMKALAESSDEDEQRLPLRSLDLCGSSVTFESVRVLLRTCDSLQSLNLTSCRALPRGIKRNYQSLDDVISLREQVLLGKFEEAND